MDEELEELEMKVLRQKALSTIPSKMKGHRDSWKLDSEFGIDKLLASETRQSRSRDHRHHLHVRPMPDHGRRPPEAASSRSARSSKSRRELEKKQRSRRASSSASSRSRSASPSYSSYSSSGSSTSGTRSRSSSTVSHSSYTRSSSSYSRSSYSSSRSYSISPQSRRDGKGHSLHKPYHSQGSHRGPRQKDTSRPISHPRLHHHSWYTEEHLPHNTSRSPLPRPRKGHPPPQEPHGSRNYRDDYPPPPKRRPPADYLQYRHGPLHVPPERHSHMRGSPPPPPPPALQRKERIVRHMRITRSPPFSDSHSYSRGPPPPHPPRPPHSPLPPSRRPRRISRSPPPPPSLAHKRGALVSDRVPPYPPSRDTRSLCGQPIRVRERVRHRSPERHPHRSHAKPLPKAPSSSVPSSSQKRSGRMAEEGRREARVPPKSRAEEGTSRSRGHESAKRSTADVHVRQKEAAAERTGSKVKVNKKSEHDEKKEIPIDHQQTNIPVLSMPPASAQLLWDDGEEEELDYDESMEDLDLHPTGTIDDLEGEAVRAHRLSVTSIDPKPGTVSWDDSEAEDGVEHRKRRRTSPLHEELYSESDEELKQDSKKEKRSSSYEEQENSSFSGAEGEGHETHISSPIRVSPERRERRVVKQGSKSESTGKSRLSAKERLYVSKNTIEEKKRLMTYHSDEPPCRLRPSLANRLGPSPRLHERVDRRSSGHGKHKGNAFAIAEEYKRRRRAELSPQEASRATMFTKRINEPDHRHSRHSFRKLEERTEENERALDKRIDSIKQKNRALEKRHKEIEKDKELHG